MMNLNELTTVYRSIDPRYPTNRAIVILTFVVIVAGLHLKRLTGSTLGESVMWAGQAGLAFFLAWALCREIDPDYPLAGFVAAGLSLIGLLLLGLPYFLALFWLIVVLRLVNRTTGVPAGTLDALAVLILGGWLSLRGNWGYGILTALAFWLDSVLPPFALRPLAFAAAALAITVVVVIFGPAVQMDQAPSLAGGLIGFGIAAVFLPVVAGSRRLASVGDRTGEHLEPTRVQGAQAIALLAGIEVAILGGIPGLGALMPLWAAVLGAWIYSLILAVRS